MGPASVCHLHPSQILLILLTVLLFTPRVAAATEISGTVKNAEGGECLGKIVVSIHGTTFSAVTSADGKFRITGLPPGKYVLQARGLGYRNLSEPFELSSPEDSKEFLIHLTPDSFRRSEVVEVHGDVFEPAAWPSVGEMTLTSSELKETSTVIANDPYRSLQSLPGVSSTSNDDFFAQFSVMGAPYEQVGVYVDDVRVPNLLHTVPSFPDAPSLSLFTGNDVEELRLMPVAFPMRYAEDNGAALVITTRTGTEGRPLFHVAVGLGDTEFLGEGGFSASHHGTWLFSARKSYIGYLEHQFNSSSFSDVGFYDLSMKVTYDLSPAHTLSLFATGGQTHINDPSLPPTADPTALKSGSNDLAVGRLGWRWQISQQMLLDTRVSYVRSGYEQDNPTGMILQRSLDRELATGTTFSWNWREGGILESGYSVRKPLVQFQSTFFNPPQPPLFSSSSVDFYAQNAFVQISQLFWKNRLRLQGGLRWAKEGTVRIEPVTGQASISLRVLRNTQLETGWGKYDQFLSSGGIGGFCQNTGGQFYCTAFLPYASTQYVVALEQRLGHRSRFRVEGFDRQNTFNTDIEGLLTHQVLARSRVESRDYSRGVQFTLQRRSENRLSGWVGYTLVYAQQRNYAITLAQPPIQILSNTPYSPTLVDQRHSVNLFATYRLTPTLRVSAKNLYGSGYPVFTIPPVVRLSPYERLDLRMEKSWLLSRWRLSLYGELLNATNHYNPVFQGSTQGPTGGVLLITTQGVPITPTVGLALDF